MVLVFTNATREAIYDYAIECCECHYCKVKEMKLDNFVATQFQCKFRNVLFLSLQRT